FARKDAPGAEAILLDLLKKKPSIGSATALGNFYLVQRKFPEAEKAYRQAVDIAPQSDEPLYALGMFYIMSNRPNDALPVFEKLSKEHQESERDRGTYARFLFNMGERDKAIGELQQIVKNYPNDRFNRDTLIAALLE